ncbi:Cell division cycle protein 27-like protein [Dinothrombium tinctorium]|uniref:Cell division cycle protein 27 homolog n=1 Tax=Dinothrombium tinctorium TaxID=1965070 RepID=A0A443RDJ0_9ACAR|nr:Cell division cycle protein 27-like protein [Dinothrombium tinctorium]
MIIQEPVQATIWFTLNHYAFSDAIFLAERLHSEVNSEESLYLLATCYYRAGKTVSAYSILADKAFKSSECRLLLARCCCDLKKFADAEEALIGNKSKLQQQSSNSSVTSAKCPSLSTEELIAEFNEAASFAAQMLAFICSKTERYEKAIDYYKKSLKLNPFLWSSFESLVQLGSKPDSSKIFNLSNVNFDLCFGSNPLVNLWNTNLKTTSEHISTSQQQTTITPQQQQPQQQQLAAVKETNQNFEIHSPFAVIKPTAESGSFEVFTPDNNSWISTTCYAPQKVNMEFKISRKTNPIQCDNKDTPMVITKTGTPTGRLSFGIFPLGEAPTIPLIMNIESNETKVQNSDSSTKISNAPLKKPQTRRSQQNSTFMPPPTRNNVPKLQIFNQSMNINTHSLESGINSLQSSTSVTNQSTVSQTGLGLRRSSRLFNSSSSVKENSTKSASRTTNQENNKKATSSKTPTKKTRRQSSATTTTTSTAQQKESELNEINKPENGKVNSNAINEELKQAGLKWQRASAEGLLNLLVELGKAALYLGQFQCQKAIDVLINLPLKHFNTGWVLNSLGKAYFEMAKYEEAVKYFEDAHKVEPHRLQGTEYYSTALWHLQQEVKLSMLAQELIEFDKNSPQTWCVAGNCFSLQKEHETAIKFLQRAIQVDPDFAYAYTLLGHELVLTEEMDHAMACFRNAIRIDPRHYNAWYGIGMIYYKQEKYQLAELHYRKALQISPCSPVLMCHIGVVQHALNKTEQALQTLNKAIEMDPKNALCKFHRASIYFAMDKHQLALNELEELKQIVPKESLVYFLIGKVHKRLGTTHLALMNFSWAMDLDPKGANNQIKEVIDKQYANDDDDVVICLDSGDEIANRSQLLNASSESSLRLRSQSHHESSSSMEAEEEEANYDGSEVMDEGI